MSTVAATFPVPASSPLLDVRPGAAATLLFMIVLCSGTAFTGYNLVSDIRETGVAATAWLPFLLLGMALLIALAFEFVNGFHDTANAVATVIYTHSLPANFAVLWSGLFNFLGVLFSSGAVAFGVIALLPVELILQVGSSAGFAMVFALLAAAILWNLGTWWLGLPASSSHTMIGAIIGVGVANALMHGRDGTSGVDWSQALRVAEALLVSPIAGFVLSALLLGVLKKWVRNHALYQAPRNSAPPPLWVRGLLVFTCTGVSFFHGSNDGQKGMGLVMLILIGTLPMAFALNRAMPPEQVAPFVALAQTAQASLNRHAIVPAPVDARAALSEYVRTRTWNEAVVPALASLTGDIAVRAGAGGTFARLPAQNVGNVRNDMYLTAETIRLFAMDSHSAIFDAATRRTLAEYKRQVDLTTRFIPPWVKIAVALALGLGTMIGWKRIVVTVGERIGKAHLTNAQGVSAELVAMGTIAAADMFGLPVSTTHVLSSGIAGTMAANRSGLQWDTLRNLAMAWVLTLPAAIVLSASLYWIFRQLS